MAWLLPLLLLAAVLGVGAALEVAIGFLIAGMLVAIALGAALGRVLDGRRGGGRRAAGR